MGSLEGAGGKGFTQKEQLSPLWTAICLQETHAGRVCGMQIPQPCKN